jgi:3-oxoacyl-[acyl-carrier-protein] synthase II
MGIVSPLGNTCEDFFSNLVAGKSGIRRLSVELDKRLSIKIAAEADFKAEDYFPNKIARTLDRVSQFAVVAAAQAWKDAGLELAEEEKRRGGVYLGTGMGGAGTLEDSYAQLFLHNARRVRPLTVVMAMNTPPPRTSRSSMV